MQEDKTVRCTPYFELAMFSPGANLINISKDQVIQQYRDAKEKITFNYINEIYIKSVFSFSELYLELRYTDLKDPDIGIVSIDRPVISFLKWMHPNPIQLSAVKVIFEQNPVTNEIIPTIYTKDGIWTMSDPETGKRTGKNSP